MDTTGVIYEKEEMGVGSAAVFLANRRASVINRQHYTAICGMRKAKDKEKATTKNTGGCLETLLQ